MSILTRLIPSLAPSPASPTASRAPRLGDGQRDDEATKFPDREIPPDSPIDQDLATDWITDIFGKVKIAFVTYHQNVWQAILFYVGSTWLTWDTGRRWWIPSVPEDDFTPQPKINYFAPTIDAMATMFNSIPAVQCFARDADGDEQYRRDGIARVAQKVADDFLLRTALKADFRSQGDQPSTAALAFILGGSLFTSLYVRDGESTQSDILGDLTERWVECDVVESLEALPRPGSRQIGGIKGTPYFFVARRMPLQEIYARYQINAQPDNDTISGANNIYQASLNYFYTGSNSVELQSEDSALVVECYIRPQGPDSAGVRKFADTGLFAVYINNTAKWVEAWQFPEHPITKFDYAPVPRLFFARTPAFDLCGIQEELQKYESIIMLHGMTNAVSPWVVDANTLISEITGRADKVIKYRSIGPNSPAPKREPPGTLDEGIYAQVQKLRSLLDTISGAASVFRGRQEGSVVAASAIAQLRGQAEQMFSAPVERWGNGWAETVRKATIFAQKSYTLPQLVRVCGDGLMYAISDFQQAKLDECIEWKKAAHGLPRTQDEMRQEMLDLFDKKAIDPSDPNVKEKLFMLFGETGMLTNFNLDATRARFENRGMKKGMPPVFRPAIEDLATHYILHTEFVKSLEFDRLPPVAQETFLAHIMETKMAMAPPPPPPPPATPSTLSVSADLSNMPAPMVDAVLEAHGISPSPDVPPPPPHHVGKPLPPGAAPPPSSAGRAGTLMQRISPPPGTPKSSMASEGHATGSPLTPTGQGTHAPGTAPGAPPHQTNPGPSKSNPSSASHTP